MICPRYMLFQPQFVFSILNSQRLRDSAFCSPEQLTGSVLHRLPVKLPETGSNKLTTAYNNLLTNPPFNEVFLHASLEGCLLLAPRIISRTSWRQDMGS
jgi:hypothetical protein